VGHGKKLQDNGHITCHYMPVNWPFTCPVIMFTAGQICTLGRRALSLLELSLKDEHYRQIMNE